MDVYKNQFIDFLRELGTLSESSIKDDISRMNVMESRGIDYTKGEDIARRGLENSDLSDSTIRSCLTLTRKYTKFKESMNIN